MQQLIYKGPADTRILNVEDLALIGAAKSKEPLVFVRGRALEVADKTAKAILDHESLVWEFALPDDLSAQDIRDLLPPGGDEDEETDEGDDSDSGDGDGDSGDT